MAHSDFSTFTLRTQWQQELDTLVAAAADACQPTGSSAGRQVASEDLRDFRSYPCPFDTMRNRALEALNDLTLADIGHAIGHLQNVQQQLMDAQTGLQAISMTDSPQPLGQARRALTALQEVSDQYPGVAKAAQQLGKALDKVN